MLQIDKVSAATEKQEISQSSQKMTAVKEEFQQKLDREILRLAQSLSLQLLDNIPALLQKPMGDGDTRNLHGMRDWLDPKPDDKESNALTLRTDGYEDSRTNPDRSQISRTQKTQHPDNALSMGMTNTATLSFLGTIPPLSFVQMGTTRRLSGNSTLDFLIQELVEKFQVFRSHEKSALSLKLKPSTLGEITLTVSEVQGKVALQFMTNHEGALFLERNRNGLESALLSQGVAIHSINVQTGNADSQNGQNSAWTMEKFVYNSEPHSGTPTTIEGFVAPVISHDVFVVPHLINAHA